MLSRTGDFNLTQITVLIHIGKMYLTYFSLPKFGMLQKSEIIIFNGASIVYNFKIYNPLKNLQSASSHKQYYSIKTNVRFMETVKSKSLKHFYNKKSQKYWLSQTSHLMYFCDL